MLLMKIVILFIHTNLKKRNWNKCALRCNLFKSTPLLSVEETSCLRMPKAQIKLNFIHIPALSTHMRHRDQKSRMYRKMIAKT